MHFAFVECCARTLRGVATLGLALFALDLVDSSSCDATSLSHGTYVVDIQVVESAGPIKVRDEYVGVANNGLPTIEIYEKFFQRGDQRRFWSDVVLKVKVRDRHNGHYDWPSYDGHGFFDDIFDIFDWGNKEDDRWSQDGQNGSDPNSQDGSDPNFWDKDVIIGIDKFVKNRTDVDWHDFRIELGTGIGPDLVPSMYSDGLYFVSDPMAKETTSFYENPPERDYPHSEFLQWNADGESHPGQGYNDRAAFWFGVNIPKRMFRPDPNHEGYWQAYVTLRQHTGLPEPQSLVLLLIGAVVSFTFRKRMLR